MRTCPEPVLATLVAGRRRSMKLATIIQRLTLEAAQLGELESQRDADENQRPGGAVDPRRLCHAALTIIGEAKRAPPTRAC